VSAQSTEEGRVNKVDTLVDAEASLPYLVAQIELLGPENVARAARRAHYTARDAGDEVIERPPGSEVTIGPAAVDAIAAQLAFIEAARRATG
jgi:hypothetical protein